LSVRKHPSSVTDLQSQMLIAPFKESQIWKVEDILSFIRIWWELSKFEKNLIEEEKSKYLE